MTKSRAETISRFNDHVNMSVEELEEWLTSDQSRRAGTGVGHQSGAKIVAMLKRNPERNPERYDEEDLGHMRKVVGYIRRHLAQEDRLKATKTKEELVQSKSTISLKNWGHDPVKRLETTAADDVRDRAPRTAGMKRKREADREHKRSRPKA